MLVYEVSMSGPIFLILDEKVLFALSGFYTAPD